MLCKGNEVCKGCRICEWESKKIPNESVRTGFLYIIWNYTKSDNLNKFSANTLFYVHSWILFTFPFFLWNYMHTEAVCVIGKVICSYWFMALLYCNIEKSTADNQLNAANCPQPGNALTMRKFPVTEMWHLECLYFQNFPPWAGHCLKLQNESKQSRNTQI